MKMQFKPLHKVFAAEASGIDITKPLQDSDVRAINAAMNQYAVLVFRGQALTASQQIHWMSHFGEIDIGLKRVFKRTERLGDERLIDISNVNAQGQVDRRDSPKNLSNFANQLWHSDSSFQNPRAKYSMLSAVTLPNFGGDTEFADLRMAWDGLPEWLKKQVEGLKAVHYALHSRFLLGDTQYTEEQRQTIPPATWPLVQTDPRTGRKILFVGIHACEIQGMTLAEGRMLLLDLMEHATQRQYVYAHQWQVGDLVMWDNTATVHRGRWFDFAVRRELRRATTEEVSI
mgnify:CR=1 FL=1